MSRDDLPREFSGPLTFDELIEMLGRVEGEEVYVSTGWFRYGKGPGFTLGVQGMSGGPSEYRDSIRFSILAPDGNRSYGGELAIPRPGFRRAKLATFDGNDFFSFSVITEVGELVIADEGSGP